MKKILILILFLTCYQTEAMHEFGWWLQEETDETELSSKQYDLELNYSEPAASQDSANNKEEQSGGWSFGNWAGSWYNAGKEKVSSFFATEDPSENQPTDDLKNKKDEPVILVIHQNGDQPPLVQEVHKQKDPEVFLAPAHEPEALKKPDACKPQIKKNKLPYIFFGLLGIGLTWFFYKHFKKHTTTA